MTPGAEVVHYGRSRLEQAAHEGRHDSCIGPGPKPLCGNGSYHAKVTRDVNQVTCDVCRGKLKR